MKTRNIFALVLAALTLTACEDYTEHNFGKPEELWEAQQVNNYVIELTTQNYADLAQNADNQALAAQDETGVTAKHLEMTSNVACFVGNITPQEYLPAILKNLVGTNQYYSMTDGSSITVRYKTGTIVSDAGYVPSEGELTQSGKYLIVAQGQEQPIATSGEGKTYGYLLLAGNTLCPETVQRFGNETIWANDVADGWAYSFEKDGDTWFLCNRYGQYLYMKGTYNNFNYTDDLGDLDFDEEWPSWTITYNAADKTYDIQNTGNNKTLRFTTQYNNVGAYDLSTLETTDGYLPLQLYKRVEGQVESVEVSEETEEVTFTLEGGEWQAKGDYLNAELTGGNTLTDMDAVYEATGWSIEFIGGIGDLTYVWRYDATYGLRASAYKSSTYYPTDAWAISPAMNLKKAERPIFSFEQAQKYAGTPVTDYLKVYVSTDYTGRGGLEAASWTDVTGQIVGEWPDGSSWDYMPMTLDLTAFAGEKSVSVAFRYISTDAVAATWEVKNVVCKELEESKE
ncbi:MAG: choice-of-anchor J domain-containing protein [Bacteroidaceae bacterium]|nr:choice-of-anchor J domain-containing protein [Bacteroidaceae bacterium]